MPYASLTRARRLAAAAYARVTYAYTAARYVRAAGAYAARARRLAALDPYKATLVAAARAATLARRARAATYA